MIIKRKALPIILTILLLCAALPLAPHAGEPSIRLLAIYGSDMLFQQNEPVRLAGFAPQGTPLHAELYQDATLLAQADTLSGADGMFSLELPGQPGSYDEYRIVLTSSGQPVAELERVVFGELWLAGGQSNMAWQYAITPEGIAESKAGYVPERPWIRMLPTLYDYVYEGEARKPPLLPQEDIPGAQWFRGDSEAAYGFSAVAWYFACNLQDALDVPVGLVDVNLGGSVIYSWLSREVIEADPVIMADVAKLWRYLPAAGWDSRTDYDHYQDMTANYNKRVYALRHFSPAGLLWYQGESELFGHVGRDLPWDSNIYKRALTLLQDSWAALFGRPVLPLVCSNLAGYTYYNERPEQPGLFNAMLGELDAANPNLATAAIYDVPISWDLGTDIDPAYGDHGAVHPIHPYMKKPVGEKLALTARGLCYGASFATPVLQTAQVTDGAVLLTFKQVGDGLYSKDSARLRGFTLAGADGYFHEAKAEIVGTNQVRVWHEGIPAPAGAAYAIGHFSGNANLFAAFGGGTLAAAPLVTKLLPGAIYLADTDWRGCDFTRIWKRQWNPALVPSFNPIGRGAKVSFVTDGVVEGAVRLERDAGGIGCFGLAPENSQGDYSREKSVSFYIRNPGSQPLKLSAVRFYTNDVTWYSPAVCVEIPAGSDWQQVTLNLNALYLYGKAFTPLLPGSSMLLKDVKRIELRFDAPLGKACAVDVDEFEFMPQQAEDSFGYGLGQIFLALLHPLRMILALIMTLF